LAGRTSHARVLDAIVRQVEQVETGAEFARLASERWTRVLSTGWAVPWDVAKAYLVARPRGEKARRPAGRTMER